MAFGSSGSSGSSNQHTQGPSSRPGSSRSGAIVTGTSIGGGAPSPCPPGYIEDPNRTPGTARCIPAPAETGGGGGGGGGWGGGGRRRPPVPQPPTPEPVPIDPQAEEDPRLQAFQEGYVGHGEDLRTGTGHAMDILTGTQQAQLEQQVEQARGAAAAAGIPFDESAMRAELQRGVNAAQAQEKLGREQMMTDYYQGGTGVMRLPMDERFTRLRLDLERDIAEAGQNVDINQLLMQKYGIDMNAASSYDQALLQLQGMLASRMIPDWGSIMSSLNTSIGGSSYA